MSSARVLVAAMAVYAVVACVGIALYLVFRRSLEELRWALANRRARRIDQGSALPVRPRVRETWRRRLAGLAAASELESGVRRTARRAWPPRRRVAWAVAGTAVAVALAAATAVLATHDHGSSATTTARASLRPPRTAPTHHATPDIPPRTPKRVARPTVKPTRRLQPMHEQVSSTFQPVSVHTAPAAVTTRIAAVPSGGGPAPLPAPSGGSAPSPLKAP